MSALEAGAPSVTFTKYVPADVRIVDSLLLAVRMQLAVSMWEKVQDEGQDAG